jgi:hypothetical protein
MTGERVQGIRGTFACHLSKALGGATLADQQGDLGGPVEQSPLIELSAQEVMALIQIANAGGVIAGNVSESDVTRLHALGLVEQRGLAMGLTAMGMQRLARLRLR